MANTRSATRTGGGGNWITRTVITVLALGGCGIALLLVIRIFGCVRGIEFSPDTFGSRTFVYYEVPLVRLRVTGVYRDSISGVLARKVGASKYTPGTKSNPPRWHLVSMTKGGSYYQDDALIIYRYLQSYDFFSANSPFSAAKESAAADFWLTWTNDHDELAQVLWPAVAEVCRKELYTFAPALFSKAEQMTVGNDNPPGKEEFQQAINEVLAKQYTELGDVRSGQGAHNKAIELYTTALEKVDDYRPALTGREKSYHTTGDADKAKQDRDRLRELKDQTR